ncbi:MAG: ATP-binding cassette domain-containing protein [Microbacterium sp.]|uniref:ATP-binding cassette domain-containing protein n=1 Tax=Microbacterium sp. TaxID=51671 RepID=UPI00272868F9|nr:ATP-binding cassette domain-containing protein [Microbacterium sp.]MDO8383884.1 ATP-binding cassette domain-containing protein [Microbacterium sp.]
MTDTIVPETVPAPQPEPGRAKALFARGAGIEKIIYAAIGRAITRRPWKARDAHGFHYHSQSLTVLFIFIVLSAVEIVIIDLIVHQWLWLRIPLLIIGIWGLVWMTGLLCAHFMRPHTVGSEGIRIRDGLDMDAHVTWDDVYSVALHNRTYEPKTPSIIDDQDGRSLVMNITDHTNIEIVLERPTTITLPGLPPKGGEQVVDRVYLWTDQPKEFLAAVSEHIGTPAQSAAAKKTRAQAAHDQQRRERMAQLTGNGPAIEVSGLVKKFGDTTALAGIDFTVEPGTVLGLLGPNGSGKTTTVRILATLLTADEGTARICGLDVTRDATKVRQLIGLTGQYASVDQDLTGHQNLAMIGRLLGMSRKQANTRAAELLDDAGLTEAAGKPAKNYSGGMRRRLDLAASVMGEAAVVFLDEPTTGLDPARRGETWAMIRRLAAQGSTVLMTTQYLEEADHLASDIIVIDSGSIVARGTPDALKRRLGNHTLDIRLRDAHLLDDAAARVEGIIHTRPAVDAPTGRLSAAVTDTEVMPAIVRALDEAGIEVSELSLRLPSLDDVFLTLTGNPSKVAAPTPETIAP